MRKKGTGSEWDAVGTLCGLLGCKCELPGCRPGTPGTDWYSGVTQACVLLGVELMCRDSGCLQASRVDFEVDGFTLQEHLALLALFTTVSTLSYLVSRALCSASGARSCSHSCSFVSGRNRFSFSGSSILNASYEHEWEWLYIILPVFSWLLVKK